MSLALYIFGGSYQTRQFYRGRLQAAVLFVEPEQFAALSEDSNIEMAGLSLAAPLKELRTGRDRLSVSYCDETAFQMYSHELIAGRLPQKETEIAIASSYLEKQGIEPALGQSVSLDLGTDIPEMYTVCGLVKDEDANNAYEAFVSQTIVEEYFSGTKIPYSVLIRMAGSENMGMEELEQYILGALEPYGYNDSDIAFSSSYFTTFDNASSNALLTVAISALILIACAAVIYSLFYISVTGKVKEYGRLRVIGMTQKQMKCLVRREGRMLSLLSIPLGIISGGIAGYLLIPGGWYWPNTIKFAVITALVMEITVMLSIRKPVRIAMQVSPVEAVRITTMTDIKKLGNTKKLYRKITPCSLAGINFSRNGKRTALTLFSLGFTGILLMCASAFLMSIDPVAMAYQELGDNHNNHNTGSYRERRTVRREKPRPGTGSCSPCRNGASWRTGCGWRNPLACSRRSRTGHPPPSPAHRHCRETRSWWRCPGSCSRRRRQGCPARKRKPVQDTGRTGARRYRGGHKSVSNNITLQSF